MRRVLKGIEEHIYYHGQRIDTVRRYSDRLLIFMLQSLRPEKYGGKGKGDSDDTLDSLSELLRQIDGASHDTGPEA